jgi:DNA invertase Pin-like site-specific DNA recombinase
MNGTGIKTQRAVIYVRQSKDAEGNGHAVERQLAECERLAAARGWTVVARETDNDVSASNGKPRPGFQRVMAMVDSRSVDVVIVWAVDRLVRKLADLEQVITACEAAGVRLATVSGDLDLSTDQGRLVGRILASVARGEVERKGTRQRLANGQAARAGIRRRGTPRPFGYDDDHVTPRPAEAEAIRWAADALLGGGTVSAVAREWSRRGLRPPQAPFGPLPLNGAGLVGWTRNSVATILKNPALAGIRTYLGEIVAEGTWTPVLPRETWEAVRALLDTRDRTIVDKNGRTRRVRVRTEAGVRTLGGGLFRCRCGNTLQGSINATGKHVYRCNPATRGDAPGPHCQQMITPVDDYVTRVIIERLARDDLADLVTPKRPDLGPLHREAASIRRNLDTLAADMVAGLISRSQMLAATERANARLAEIGAQLAAAAESSALAPFAAGESARAIWAGLDASRRRAVIDALCTVVVHPAGRGARTFDPETVEFTWGQL